MSSDGGGALASAVLGAAARVDEHRGAVSRCALLWWDGRAAEHYRGEVGARSAALGALSEELQAAAALVEAAVVQASSESAARTPTSVRTPTSARTPTRWS
ncbi:MAG: hypothetical protein ACRCSN_05945 [Dermatophilaceae bacterium]